MTDHHQKVFVIGASGYVGHEAALAYSRAGYIVYGLVRTEEKAKKLAVGEVFPVIGDLTDTTGKWIDVVKQCEIVLYCAVDFSNQNNDYLAVTAILSALSSAGTSSHPARFIFTSGALVYKGIQWPQDEPATDDSPLEEDGHILLQQRIKIDKVVLKAYEETKGTVAGFVVRPSYIYGKNSQNFYKYFEQALKGDVVIEGGPHIYGPTIHVDDLCSGFLKLTEHPFEQIHSRAFVLCAPGGECTQQQIAEAFSRAAGYTGSIRYEPPTPFRVPFQKHLVFNPVNAQKLLGWAPRHPHLLKEVDVLFTGWKASNNIGTWN